MNQQRKPRVDPRVLIAKLSQEGSTLLQREIIAPLLPAGRIRTRLNGMVYDFKLLGEFAGWGRFRPVNTHEAELLGEAPPWERGMYLELYPALRMILLWPDPRQQPAGIWWALPFNASDARQRFGLAMEPLPVLLCDPTQGAERFARVIVRVDGSSLWFEGPDTLADPTHADWLRDAADTTEAPERFLAGLAGSERQALLFWQIRQLEIAMEPVRRQQARAEQRRQMLERQRSQQRQALERQHTHRQQQAWLEEQRLYGQLTGRLEHALTKADAVLHSYSTIPGHDGSPGHILVEWSAHGHSYKYRSTVDANLTVVSSGICLSGHDREFDLTSLVRVMTDSPWARD